MPNRILILLILVFNISIFAGQRQIIDIEFKGSSEKKSASQARQEIFKKAVEETSFRYIREMIGEDKTERNKSLIKTRIVEQWKKFVLYQKGSKLEKSKNNEEPGRSMAVTMKLSLDNLKSLLLSEGLLYKMDGPPKILPVIQFEDRKNSRQFAWWSGVSSDTPERDTSKGFLKTQDWLLSKKLRKAFGDRGFWMLAPQRHDLKNSLPKVLQGEKTRREDILLTGEFLGAQVVVRGEVKVAPSKSFSDVYILTTKMVAYQTGNSRVIAEVSRRFQTETGNFRQVVQKKMNEVFDAVAVDLSIQVLESWQKGTFGSTLIKIKIIGNLNYQETMILKQKLSRMNPVKAIKERLFEKGKVTFEVNASMNAKALSLYLAKQSYGAFNLKIDQVAPGFVEILVQ